MVVTLTSQIPNVNLSNIITNQDSNFLFFSKAKDSGLKKTLFGNDT